MELANGDIGIEEGGWLCWGGCAAFCAAWCLAVVFSSGPAMYAGFGAAYWI